MKLLLDENLSRRVVPFLQTALQTAYPGSTQVALVGMERASDLELWDYAKNGGFVIVTKDSDYYDLSLLRGAPPHVIWIKVGNVTKAKVTQLLIDSHETIERLLLQDGMACVEIY